MKPTKEQIENATDKQLAEWSCIYVMKWKWPDALWNPAQNIEQAFQLREKIKTLPKHIQFHFQIYLIGIVALRLKKEKLLSVGDVAINMNAQDITKAALLSVEIN